MPQQNATNKCQPLHQIGCCCSCLVGCSWWQTQPPDTVAVLKIATVLAYLSSHAALSCIHMLHTVQKKILVHTRHPVSLLTNSTLSATRQALHILVV